MGRSPDLGAVVAVLGLVLAACAGTTAASAPAALPGPEASAPPAWAGLRVTEPILGGPVFGGPGNQFVMAAVAYRGGYLAAGEDLANELEPSNGVVWRSDDGSTWRRVTDPTGTFNDAVVESLATNGTRVLAFGHDGHGGADRFEWISDDGATWRRIGAAQATMPGSLGAVGGNGTFLAVAAGAGGASAASILRSDDGERWTETSFASTYPHVVVNGVTPYLGGWVALGSKQPDPSQPCCGPTPPGLAWFSSDGMTWWPAHLDAPHSMGEASPGAAGLIALGSGPLGCGGCVEGPNLWHSTDGLSWDLVGQQPMADVVYGSDGSRLVRATSDQRTVDLAWSVDGLAWQPLATSLPFHDEHGRFVVGSDGILFLENSPNGTETDAGVWYLPAR